MNRQQRRQQEKKNKQTLTRAEAKQAASLTARVVMDKAIKDYSAAIMLCLHDKLGFGPKRAQRFMAQVEELFDSINQGYLSVDDVIKTVEEELGIQIK